MRKEGESGERGKEAGGGSSIFMLSVEEPSETSFCSKKSQTAAEKPAVGWKLAAPFVMSGSAHD